MICALSFPHGKPFAKDSDLNQLIYRSLEEEQQQIRVFPSGTHNLTPENLPKGNWYYTLEVRADGSGTLEMIARTRDVVTYDIEKKKMSGPRPGDRTIRLPDDETLVLIAGQKTAVGPHLFHILFHLPSPIEPALSEEPSSSTVALPGKGVISA